MASRGGALKNRADEEEEAQREEGKSKREGVAKISISTGDYSPVRNTTSDAWVALGRYPLGPGENRIEIPIDWALVAPVGLPTTFDKEVDGRKFNVYHFLHIYNLTQLARMTGEEEFAHYAAKWTEYTRRWADMPLYRDAGAELCAYSAENVVIAAGQCGGHDMQD